MIQEKKTTDRIVSLWGLYLFCLCMVFCLLTDMSVEAAETLTSGDWEYEILSDGTVTITTYNGTATKVVIPEKIDGKSVTRIEAYAFEDCSSLTSITIPSSVTNIGSLAFSGCSSLTSITIPNSVTSMGDYTFDWCSSLTSITIPNSVTNIGECVFKGCSSLTRITIPNSVTNIGKYAFKDCSSLTSITIPSSVTSIGEYAFKGCSNLTSITIPNNVTSIGKYTFHGCSSLTSITIPNSVTSIGEYAFEDCNSLTSITIPSSVTSIGDYVFYGCSSLTSINVAQNSQSYTSKNGILYNKSCETLICCPGGKQGTITIPSSVTSIKKYAFYGCSSLTSITIPSSVTNIEGEAFMLCSSLASITIPSSVTSIGAYAFSACSSNLTIYGEADSYAEEYAENWKFKFRTGKPCVTHTPVTDLAIDPTCTKNGKTEGSHCSVCDMIIKAQEVIPAAHTPVTDPAIDPTCTKKGKTEGIHCSVCDAIIKAQKDIPATGHTYRQVITKATAKKNGSIEAKCSACGGIELTTTGEQKTTTIYAASGIKLSKTSFTYNGKNQKPTVILKDSQGKTLPAGSYKVTSPKTSKNVGKYTVTVTLQGNYSGTVKLTYQITPKSTSLSKLTAKKKGFTAKWKKQTSQTTGYELQYSTSSKFKGAKTVTVKKNKTVSQSIAKLKAGKKYYVRIRTYKTVKVNGKIVKLCSGWSKAKSVKTKR